MKILCVADEPSEYLWGPEVRRALAGIDLILSCGDLPAAYLEYLATFTHAPVLYVPGNHDGGYLTAPPEGCRCVDGRLAVVGGLRVLGLGGCVRYNSESPYQYTQRQMRRRVRRLALTVLRHGGFDILLTHAGAFGLGDQDDRAHVGFLAFRELLDRWHPAFFIHGHSHLTYSVKQKRLSYHEKTQIINAYERYILEIPDRMEERI